MRGNRSKIIIIKRSTSVWLLKHRNYVRLPSVELASIVAVGREQHENGFSHRLKLD